MLKVGCNTERGKADMWSASNICIWCRPTEQAMIFSWQIVIKTLVFIFICVPCIFLKNRYRWVCPLYHRLWSWGKLHQHNRGSQLHLLHWLSGQQPRWDSQHRKPMHRYVYQFSVSLSKQRNPRKYVKAISSDPNCANMCSLLFRYRWV